MPVEKVDNENLEKFVEKYEKNLKHFEKSLIEPVAGSKKAKKESKKKGKQQWENKNGEEILKPDQQSAYKAMMTETQKLLTHVLNNEENMGYLIGYVTNERKTKFPKKHIEDSDEPTPKPPNPLLDSLKAMAG